MIASLNEPLLIVIICYQYRAQYTYGYIWVHTHTERQTHTGGNVPNGMKFESDGFGFESCLSHLVLLWLPFLPFFLFCFIQKYSCYVYLGML